MPAEAVRPKRVGIIGAGSAGMAAAWSLSRFPEKYAVTVIEPSDCCGGVACTLGHEGERVNYGVQGGSPPSHQNTIELMRAFGVAVGDVRLDVSFGKGKHNWKNYESKPLQEELKKEIKSFGRVLKWISRLEFISIFVSIEFVLRLCRFSADFRQRMVYPLVTLFFGTGNMTAQVSSAIVARVFLDKSLAIFEYDPQFLLSETPTNVAFDDLQDFYAKMRRAMEKAQVQFRMRTRATKVVRDRGAVYVHVEGAPDGWRAGSDQRSGDVGATPSSETIMASADGAESTAPAASAVPAASAAPAAPPEEVSGTVLEFDELIFACPANVAKELLGTSAGWWERSLLSSVEYYHDLTVTHTDDSYMRKHYEIDGKAIYFIKTYESNPDHCEMGFDLTAYQPTLRKRRERDGQRVYQTIYLDRQNRHEWSIQELDSSKVIDRAWWVAFSHTYRHFRSVVPWVWTVQGRRHTWYAGSWTLFNTHDIAIASGLAAAYRLGAPYPFAHNKTAAATFDTVLGQGHLRWRRGGADKRSNAVKQDPQVR